MSGRVVQVLEQKARLKKLGPILVSFDHGKLKQPASAIRASVDAEWGAGDDTGPTKIDLELAVDGCPVKYSSRQSAAKAFRHSPYQKTFLAIRSKSSGTVKLVEANLVRVAAVVNPPKTTNTLLTEEHPSHLTDVEKRMENKKHLVATFGQSKGKRIYEEADILKKSAENSHEQVRKALDFVSEDALVMPGQQPAAVLTPPCNRNATSVKDVYDLRDLLSQTELDALEKQAKDFMDNYGSLEDIRFACYDQKLISPLLCTLIESQVGVAKPDLEQVGVSLYVEGLLSLLKFKNREMKLGSKALPYFLPHNVKEKIWNSFVQNQALTPECRDRCVCHAIVAALLVNGFNFPFHALTKSVRIKTDMLHKLVSVTGAYVHKDALTDEQHVVLKLPLAFFDTDRTLGKKKKKN